MLILGPHSYERPDRRNKLSVFSRGKSDVELSTDAERLVGIVNGDFTAIENGGWDFVFDLLAAYQFKGRREFIRKRVRVEGESA